MYRIEQIKRAATPAMTAAFARVESLEDEYARAVQRIIASGNPLSWDLLIVPVDRCQEKMVQLALAWTAGKASEADVIEAAKALAGLMEMVIGPPSAGSS